MDSDFDFSARDLKHYPHFDAPISRQNIRRLLREFAAGPKRGFYPFFCYEQSWQPFRSGDVVKPERKTREIRYVTSYG